MNLIFIYGPPAVGKLTTAIKLSEKLNYKIFHNHLVVDLVKSVYEQFTNEFNLLRESIQNMVIDSCGKSNLSGLIFTICYAYPDDLKVVDDIENIVLKNNGNIIYIQLLTDVENLKKRVINEDRKKYRKLINPDKLLVTLSKWELSLPVLKNNNLLFDNSSIDSENICDIIINYMNEIKLKNFNINDVVIKEAKREHAIIINSLHKLSAFLLCKNFYEIDDLNYWLVHRTPEGYYESIDKKNMYIAEYNKRIIGFLNVKKGEISQIFVHPDYVNKGVGKKLLTFGINIAKTESKIINLESTLNAINFYKKFGFNEINKKDITKSGLKISIANMKLEIN